VPLPAEAVEGAVLVEEALLLHCRCFEGRWAVWQEMQRQGLEVYWGHQLYQMRAPGRQG
jgi:hypothetical protein